jgi:hypothetical protein
MKPSNRPARHALVLSPRPQPASERKIACLASVLEVFENVVVNELVVNVRTKCLTAVVMSECMAVRVQACILSFCCPFIYICTSVSGQDAS